MLAIADFHAELWKNKEDESRLLIGVSGIPGSGKTTLAAAVARRINTLYNSSHPNETNDNFAVVIPMDGFHLYRAQLASMPDPATAIHRRGAAFTFDADRFYKLVQQLREPTSTKTVYAPSFGHAIKDPVEDDIAVQPQSRILIIEGLYLALNREPWSSAARLMDELWFIAIDRKLARGRLIKRHVASGIVPDEAAADHRITSTDFLNANDIEQNRLPAQEIIDGNVQLLRDQHTLG